MTRLLVALVLLVAVLVAATAQDNTPPLQIYGHHFWNVETGQSVAFKGVAYYPRPNDGPWNANGVDFFSNQFRPVWEPDIAHFQELGINAIRLYAVDPSQDHDDFFCALQQAGIYVIVGLSATCLDCAIAAQKTAPACYTAGLKRRGMQIINAFSKYTNVIGFDATNEVHLKSNVTDTGPCQRKFVGDMRKYIRDCANMPRKIPVGLSFADKDRSTKIAYYNCAEQQDGDEEDLGSAEWFGFNVYQNCNPKHETGEDSRGFRQMVQDFRNYSIPVIVTEFGCTNEGYPTVDGYEGQRTWRAAEWFHQGDHAEIFAGTFAFEYSTEAIWAERTGSGYPFTKYSDGDRGLGYYTPSNCDHSNVLCQYIPKPNFGFLKEAYAATKTVGRFQRDMYVPRSTSRTVCPAGIPPVSSFEWESDGFAGLYCWAQNVNACGWYSESPTSGPSTDEEDDQSQSISASSEAALAWSYLWVVLMPIIGFYQLN